MRLAAVYIHEHYLFDGPQTINFGGKNFFDFKMCEGVLNVSMEINESFTDGFFGADITLMSAIVGANGAGKTSILKIINAGFHEHTKAVFIYENIDGSVAVDNRTGIRPNAEKSEKTAGFKVQFPEGTEHHIFNSTETARLYYSPISDRSIEDMGSPLSLNSSDSQRKLGDINMDNIRKDAIFLHSDICQTIKKIYPDFPSYDTLYIVPKVLHKSDFRKVYIDTNLGNPQKAETLMHLIEEDLSFGDFSEPERMLQGYLKVLRNSNITDFLQEIWDMPQYENKTANKDHLIHDSSDFLKSIEINIISFLVINDTYPVTEFSGSYAISEIIKSTTFYEILDHFLAKYTTQYDRRFYNEYKEKITLDKADELIQTVMGHYIMNALNYQDLEVNDRIKTSIHHNINGLMNIRKFYDILAGLSDAVEMDGEEYVLRIDVKRKDIQELLEKLFNSYAKMREYFSHLPMTFRDIIDIDTNVHLSYGEKSILNLYSTFYEFTRSGSEQKNADYFLITLDEADLGYHPIWKRKFIQALSMTMPKLFTNIKGRFSQRGFHYQRPQNICPTLQIIIATHDPLTLSDFPNSSVVYLRKSEIGSTEVLRKPHSMKSFGANITDLLAHSFFVEDGLIGDFAREKIEETIKWLNEQKNEKDNSGAQYSIDMESFGYHENIIKIIDEPVIRIKLAQMLDDLKDQKEVQRELIRREIELLNEKLENI